MNIQIRGACMRFIIILKLCIYFQQTVDFFIQHPMIFRTECLLNIASILLYNYFFTTKAVVYSNSKYSAKDF